MRIACLQFAPQVGDVDNNLSRADAVLEQANPQDLDLLVLPELAFSGFNFKSLKHISPYLEPTTGGISASWARATALKYNCVVVTGYPETVDIAHKWPASPEYYNSALVANPAGQVIVNYRKAHLYPTEERWSLEGPYGFCDEEIAGFGSMVMGIGMDINPYKFEAPWTAWEFANHIIYKDPNLVIIPMAWPMPRDSHTTKNPQEPDMETLAYWLSRLEPVIRAEQKGEIIVIFANRSGIEDDIAYAGTSAILGIDAGEVKVYGVLGCAEHELLIVDTDQKPQAKLISDSNNTALDYNVHSPIVSNFDLPSLDNAEFPASIDAILHTAIPVSPVEPHFLHAYYASQPPRTEDLLEGLSSNAQRGASYSAATSVRSSVGSSIQSFKRFSTSSSKRSSAQYVKYSFLSHNHVSNVPPQEKSPKTNRNRTRESVEPQYQALSHSSLQELHLNTTESASNSEIEDNPSPSSVSSMTTHTPWDKSLSISQKNDKLKTTKSGLSQSPSPARHSTPSKLAQRRPTPAPQKRTSSRTSRTGRTSRSSRKHEDFVEAVPLTPSLTPAPEPEALIAQITITPSENELEPRNRKISGADRLATLQGPSRGGSALPLPRDETPPEVRPRSTVW